MCFPEGGGGGGSSDLFTFIDLFKFVNKLVCTELKLDKTYRIIILYQCIRIIKEQKSQY